MKTTKKLLVVFAAALVLLCSTGCAKLKARDHLNKGVQAFKNSKFEQAIDHFQQAVVLDPTLINARLYLATALAQQYIPGVDAPDNNRFGEQAIDQYKQVLQSDPRNINSIKGIAYLYLQMKKFPLAKEYYKKASELDPNDLRRRHGLPEPDVPGTCRYPVRRPGSPLRGSEDGRRVGRQNHGHQETEG